MKQGGLGGSGSVKAGAVLPSINKLPKPGNNSNTVKVGMPGIKQASKKDPMKSAEQTQNKDIKDIKLKEAQSVLKKPEMVKFEKNGQWSLAKDNSVKPKGENIYDEVANLKRKQTRTSEVREGVGSNRAVRQLSSAPLGSAKQQAAREATRDKAKSKKMPVKSITLSPKEKAEIEARQNAKKETKF
jgi:hypothetical protein